MNKWNAVNEQKIMDSYKEGYTAGIYDSVLSLYEQTNNCQLATLFVGNFSKQIVDLACINLNLEEP